MSDLHRKIDELIYIPKRARNYLPKFHQMDVQDNSDKSVLAQTIYYIKNGP